MKFGSRKVVVLALAAAMVLLGLPAVAALAEENDVSVQGETQAVLVEEDATDEPEAEALDNDADDANGEKDAASLDDMDEDPVTANDNQGADSANGVSQTDEDAVVVEEEQAGDQEGEVGVPAVIEDESAPAEEEVGASGKKYLPIGSWCSYGIYFYTGKPIRLEYSTNLVYGRDYIDSYKNNIKPGTATATFIGKGSYADAEPRTIEYRIDKTSISKATVSDVGTQRWTGKAVCPKPIVKIDGRTLVEGTDYKLSYKNNVDMGTADVVVTGIGGYKDAVGHQFSIKGDISLATVSKVANQTYTGSSLCPRPKVTLGGRTLTLNTDYKLTYFDNTKVGDYALIIIAGTGNYVGSQPKYFKIVAKDLSKATISSIADRIYTGSAINPTPTVKVDGRTLKRFVDYNYSYKANINAGTATVIVAGTGNYTGTAKKTFKIIPASLSTATVASIPNQTYTSKAIRPKPTVKYGGNTLVPGTDYTLSYKNNTVPGTATMTFTGKGNYTGNASKKFTIVKASVSGATVSPIPDQTYTGKAICPKPTVTLGGMTLTLGTDYTLSYKANTHAGTATVTVTGKGNYTGSKQATFKIRRDFATAGLKCTYRSLPAWTGGPVVPTGITVKLDGTTLVANTDYTLSFTGNDTPGKAIMTVTGKGKYSGSVKKSFTIPKANIASAEIAIDTQHYTGNEICPKPKSVTLYNRTLEEGKDYTIVSYANNVKCGRASITIKAVEGNSYCTGTTTGQFVIEKISIEGENTELLWNGEFYETDSGAMLPSFAIKVNGEYLLPEKDWEPVFDIIPYSDTPYWGPNDYDDYSYTYSGKGYCLYDVTICGRGAYEGRISLLVQIDNGNPANCTWKVIGANY